MPLPDSIIFWLPRDDEHALAASLGLCEKDPALLRDLVEAAAAEAARTMEGVPARIHRWHVWRVVRALHRTGGLNTPNDRAAAYVWLSRQVDT